MASYLVNHQKKKRIFAKRERELRHQIKHSVPADMLAVAAEKLRAAKIAVFKCSYARMGGNQPYNFSAEDEATRNAELRHWLTMSAQEIVERYRSNPS